MKRPGWFIGACIGLLYFAATFGIGYLTTAGGNGPSFGMLAGILNLPGAMLAPSFTDGVFGQLAIIAATDALIGAAIGWMVSRLRRRPIA